MSPKNHFSEAVHERQFSSAVPPPAGRTLRPPGPLAEPPRSGVAVLLSVAILLAVWAIYLVTLNFDLLRWDDADYVSENPVLSLPLGAFLGRIATGFVPHAHGDYLPVTLLSYWLEYRAVGADAWLYHLDNVLLYSAGCVTLFWVLQRTIRRPLPALTVTLLFAVHPLNTEAVAWVSERKTVLSFVLSGLALLLAIPPDDHRRTSWKRTIGSVGLYGLACLSKSAVVFFPLLIWAHRWSVAGVGLRRSALAALPYCIPAALTAYLRIQGHELSGQAGMRPFHDEMGYHLSHHLLTILSIIGRYITTVLIPIRLNHCYPLEVTRTVAEPTVWIGGFVLAMAVAGAVLLRRTLPAAAFGLIWFLAGLLPHMQIQPIPPALRADRYVFFALPGFILFTVLVIDRIVSGKKRIAGPEVLGIPAGVAVIVLGALAFDRTRVWADDRALWEDSLRQAPDSAIAHSFLGYELLDDRDWGAAEEHFRRALARRPANFMALNGLAVVLAEQGQLDEALRALRQSLKDPQAPPGRQAQTLALIGRYELEAGRLDESLAAYARAAELRPFDHTIHTGYALTLSLSGRAVEALNQADQALQLAPNDTAALYVRARILTDLGRHDEALQAVRLCIGLDPGYALAYEQGGIICSAQQNWSEAAHFLEQAVRLAPENRQAADLLQSVRKKLAEGSP